LDIYNIDRNIRLVSLQDGEYPEYSFVITSARKTLPHAST